MKLSDETVRRGVLAGGNWLVDYVKVIDVYPQPEHLGNILSQTEGTGGAAYNVLITLARCGALFPLYGAGLVGDDELGRRIRRHCRENAIDVRHLEITGKARTSFTDVMTERDTGRRTFFHDRGANALWRGANLDFNKIPARIFHFGYFLLLDKLDEPDATYGTRAGRLLAAARRAGMKTSVDAVSENSARFGTVVKPALPHTDYCILNEFEAGKITGAELRKRDGTLDGSALRRSAKLMLELGVHELVVIHCPEGAYAQPRRGEGVWQSSLKLPPGFIAGTAGAGDAFCAGVLLGLHEGWELRRCLVTGTCLAASSLSHATCTDGIRPLRSALALAKKFGFNDPK